MHFRIPRLLARAAGLVVVAVAAASSALGAPEDSAEDGHAPIRWSRVPDPHLLGRIVPNGVMPDGGDGTTALICTLSRNGWLKQCRVEEENPKGLGAASLAVAVFFKFEATQPGFDLTDEEVRIPINWHNGGSADHNLVATPIWLHAPSPVQVAAAYPAGKTGDGRVVFECQLTRLGGLEACKPRLSDPDNNGWVTAARTLLPEFKAPLQAQGGMSTAGARVLVPVQLLEPNSPELQISPIGNRPVWSHTPDPQDMVFPPAARAKGIRSGRGDVECRVGADWGLTDCRVMREHPEGVGFGDAALRVAAEFSLSAWSLDGRPTEGHRIRLPISFLDDQAPSAPTRPVTWLETPSAQQIVDAIYQAHAENPETAAVAQAGEAVLRCTANSEGRLEGCVIASETPAGADYGRAALLLAPAYRADRAGEVAFAVKFAARPNPQWRAKPSGDDLLTAVRAARINLERLNGSTVMECRIAVDGNLKACRVLSAEPTEAYGQAGLFAARNFKFYPLTYEGRPVEGTIRIPLSFRNG